MEENKLISKGDLVQFTGTENWYRHFTKLITYTDGVKFLADNCKAHWLIDLVASYQVEKKVRKETFQVWKFVKTEPNKAVVTLEDGNKHIVLKQKIDYTDFPFDDIDLWCCDGVLMLPSEY